MPILSINDYKPPFLLRNNYINTLYPYFFRKFEPIKYHRKRVHTVDNDFFDVDFSLLKNPPHQPRKLAIIIHGLEGSSHSQYMKGHTIALNNAQYDVAAINFRSCSGQINITKRLYHSGFTEDLHYFINNYSATYERIYIIGFSMAGNMVLKYVSDAIYKLSNKIKAIVAVSAPIDLKGSSNEFKKTRNKIYDYNFLNSLIDKVKEKHGQFPDAFSLEDLKKIKTLYDFDDYFTAPMHDFESADDYHEKSNAEQFLSNIKIPSLLINSRDDSFLSIKCYPYEQANESDYLYLLTPEYGGHLGFANFRSSDYWIESQVVDFLDLW